MRSCPHTRGGEPTSGGAGGTDHTIRLWRISDGALVRTLTGHKDILRQIVLSPDGRTLASLGADNAVRLWSLK